MRARREAANEAYTTTLAPIHTYLVRAAVRTSMFLLPDRTAFLKSIGETGAGTPLLVAGEHGVLVLFAAQAKLGPDAIWLRFK